MELELNLLDWNANELERELELEDMKHTSIKDTKSLFYFLKITY